MSTGIGALCVEAVETGDGVEVSPSAWLVRKLLFLGHSDRESLRRERFCALERQA